MGWSHYQVRKDAAIRRHWQLVCCAFTFCWWACADFVEGNIPPGVVLNAEESAPTPVAEAERGKKEGQKPAASSVLASGVEEVRAWLVPYVCFCVTGGFSDREPAEEYRSCSMGICGEGSASMPVDNKLR